jgi:serine/threonine protein kinase
LRGSPSKSAPNRQPAADARDSRRRREALIEQFEAAFREGKWPSLEAFLPDDPAERRAVLIELAHADLELRLKAGEAARADDYLQRFPELAADPEVARDLRATESRIRTGEACQILAAARGADGHASLGGYRIKNSLGAGGMGLVFLAEDLQLRRPVELKVMRPSLAASPTSRQRFLREARAMAAVRHPNVVTIYQVGEDGGAPFLAMEFLAGESLEDRLARAGRLPAADVVRLGRAVAEGLAAAHERGVIHRDVKPSDIWLESGPRGPWSAIKLLDFGLARAAADDAHLTETGAVVGPPAYMAPEQTRSQPADARSDLFSLGSVLYRACTGRVPFLAPDVIGTLMEVAAGTPVPPRQLDPQIPRALSDLVMCLLEKDPAARPPSAAAVAQQLRRLEGPEAAPATSISETQVPTSNSDRAGRGQPGDTDVIHPPRPGGAWRRWALACAGGLLLVFLVSFVFRGPVGAGKEPSQPQPDAAESVDRRAVEWVLSIGGEPTIWTDATRERLVRALGDLPDGPFKLMGANLQHKKVTDAGLEHLKGLSGLIGLDLLGVKISDEGLKRLRGLENLSFLTLDSDAITDAGLEHLNGLQNLTDLRLRSNGVSDSGLDHLKHLPNLVRVLLASRQLSDAGLDRLRRLPNLVHLELDSARLTDAGLARLKDFPNKLLYLGFGHARLTDAGMERLKDLPDLQTLSLVRATGFTDVGFESLKNLKRLSSLDLGATPVTDAGLECLGSLGQLTHLDIGWTKEVTDAGLPRLARLTNLESLGLGGTKVTDDGLKHLSGLTKLTHLALDQTKVTDAGLEHLWGLANLRSPLLRSTSVTAVGVARLREKLPKCRVLVSPDVKPAG